jgi:hypothetical protein
MIMAWNNSSFCHSQRRHFVYNILQFHNYSSFARLQIADGHILDSDIVPVQLK